MGTLYLVRHGQASLGAADYDQLSELGQRQAVRLGEYLRGKGLGFEAVLTGTLRRHLQTLAGIAQGYGALPEALRWPGLNEYDSAAVVRAIHEGEPPATNTPEAVRQHFRLLRQGLLRWMDGSASPAGMPTHAEFLAGITAALDHVRAHHSGNVLLVSSGGPISTAVGHLLGATPQAVVELNLRIRNSALTEFHFNPKRHVLVSFNTLPHLDHHDHAGWITHA
ncbi:MAG TPA: histidine phosphatase family protein [Ideonella sp.]|nr:histidine phosphatase family protein [Ideonella sp.]